jgi:hypothetical protein
MLIVRLGDDRAGWVESVHVGVQFGMMTNTPPERFSTGWQSSDEPASPFPLHTHSGFGTDAVKINIPESDGVRRRSVAVYEAVVPPYALLLAAAVRRCGGRGGAGDAMSRGDES